jgi:hypothetical protein
MQLIGKSIMDTIATVLYQIQIVEEYKHVQLN